MKQRVVSLAMVITGCALLGACGSSGGARNAPDEFAIVTKAPLTVPPDYALRPPRPEETRPERLSTAERTRQLVLGDQTQAPPTDGELFLLQQIGAVNVDPNIRAILAAENGGHAEKDQNLANQILFWRIREDGSIDDSDAPLRVDDRAAWEAERQELITAVTGEKGHVTISQDDRAVLSLPGVR